MIGDDYNPCMEAQARYREAVIARVVAAAAAKAAESGPAYAAACRELVQAIKREKAASDAMVAAFAEYYEARGREKIASSGLR